MVFVFQMNVFLSFLSNIHVLESAPNMAECGRVVGGVRVLYTVLVRVRVRNRTIVLQ